MGYAYFYTLLDVPGVVAANNYLAFFNPVGSGVVHIGVEVGIGSYSTGAVAASSSLSIYRITAASAGTLVTTSDIHQAVTTDPAPKTQLRIGNPTVTRLNNTPIFFKTPPISTGAGSTGTTVAGLSTDKAPQMLPGQGTVFSTSVSDIAARWSISVAWEEIGIDSVD